MEIIRVKDKIDKSADVYLTTNQCIIAVNDVRLAFIAFLKEHVGNIKQLVIKSSDSIGRGDVIYNLFDGIFDYELRLYPTAFCHNTGLDYNQVSLYSEKDAHAFVYEHCYWITGNTGKTPIDILMQEIRYFGGKGIQDIDITKFFIHKPMPFHP